jgi:hypothetical protein
MVAKLPRGHLHQVLQHWRLVWSLSVWVATTGQSPGLATTLAFLPPPSQNSEIQTPSGFTAIKTTNGLQPAFPSRLNLPLPRVLATPPQSPWIDLGKWAAQLVGVGFGLGIGLGLGYYLWYRIGVGYDRWYRQYLAQRFSPQDLGLSSDAALASASQDNSESSPQQRLDPLPLNRYRIQETPLGILFLLSHVILH